MGRTVRPVGKPDAGNQHVRFDERGRKTERSLQGSVTASVLDSTDLKILEEEREMREGASHAGMSAVIGLTAIRP